jgi:hypothetical protein
MLEQYMEGVKFLRVDSDIAEALAGDGETGEIEALTPIFKEVLGDKVKIESVLANMPLAVSYRLKVLTEKYRAHLASHNDKLRVFLVSLVRNVGKNNCGAENHIFKATNKPLYQSVLCLRTCLSLDKAVSKSQRLIVKLGEHVNILPYEKAVEPIANM